MAVFYPLESGDDGSNRRPIADLLGLNHPATKRNQIILSLVLGISAFIAFCILRPRWPGLYAARRRQKDEASALPELPGSFLGWMLPLWRITDQQILASAGLDAYVFLAFFKMAMKFLLVTFFFSLVIIKPVHDANPDYNDGKNKTDDNPSELYRTIDFGAHAGMSSNDTGGLIPPEYWETDYLWMYVVFAYLFTGIAIYLIFSETHRIVEIRQEYLGMKTSVTDRTIRLSAIPAYLHDENQIKEFIETLDIGRVESVTLCRNWKELDEASRARTSILRRLEEAYTVHLGRRRIQRNRESLPIVQPAPPSPRPIALPDGDGDGDESTSIRGADDQPHVMPYERERPKTTIRYGWMKLRSERVDAIDHYTEELRRADENIKELRQKHFDPAPLAFVTMDSVAAAQMAIQAVLDPSPNVLLAKPSPSPSDVVWPNTYMPRRSRMARSWSITVLIVILTVFWFFLLIPIAFSLNLETIGKVWPQLEEVLEKNAILESFVRVQLPTLLTSLLMLLVTYLYYYLSWYQGTISAGDVELSAISKNFFFTFFNFFVAFTILGTASNFFQIFLRVGDALRDIGKIAYTVAYSLQQFLNFYVNFVILQGIGLFPFRLLEFGSVVLYPLFRMGAKTPRDYAELVQPPVFCYGFYLPGALLVFIICLVYSVLRSSWQILLAGFIYFFFGHFVYKYQLLYAMDHQQQTTGRAWAMICDRLFVGLVFFQISTASQLVFQKAVARSVLMLPLIVATIWIAIRHGRTFKPLMNFIALRSVKRGELYTDNETPPNEDSTANSVISTDLAPERRAWAEIDGQEPSSGREANERNGRAVDKRRSKLRFVNPSLIAPLESIWIMDESVMREGTNEIHTGDETV